MFVYEGLFISWKYYGIFPIWLNGVYSYNSYICNGIHKMDVCIQHFPQGVCTHTNKKVLCVKGRKRWCVGFSDLLYVKDKFFTCGTKIICIYLIFNFFLKKHLLIIVSNVMRFIITPSWWEDFMLTLLNIELPTQLVKVVGLLHHKVLFIIISSINTMLVLSNKLLKHIYVLNLHLRL